MNSTNDVLRWGVIGCSDVFERKSGRAFSEVSGSRLIAFLSRSEERAKSYAQRFGAPETYTHLDDMLGNPEINAVYICTPPFFHAKQTIRCLKAGKHVLCEKPMATQLKDCDEMIRVAEEADVQLMVAYYRRQYPVIVKVKELLESGAIGRPIKIRFEFAMLAAMLARGEHNWRFDPTVAGGGALWDVGSHRIDLMLYLMDEVLEVSAFTDAIEYQVPVDESSTVMMRFESGAQGVGMIHWNNPYGSDQLEIGGTDGRILADLERGHIQIWNADKQQDWTLPNPKVTHQGLVEDLVQAVTENKTNCCSGSEGRKTNAVLAASGLSNKERRVVRLEELESDLASLQ